MSFLHPWALIIGAAAIGLPVLIHWLTRPKPTRMPLSTVRFVQQIVQQRKARSRLRDILILLMRGIAVTLVALAFARPWSGQKQLIDPSDAGDVVRVVVLDVSQSSAAVSGGTTALDRARAVASTYLKGTSGVRAALVLAGAKPVTVFDQPSANLSALRDAVTTCRTQPQRLDAQRTINRCAELLSADDPTGSRTLELVLISDFQRSNWSAVDLSTLPKETKIQFESVAPQKPVANLAITSASVTGRLEQGREAVLAIEVGNYSASPRTVEVAVAIGDTPQRLSGLCPPGAKTVLNAPIVLQTPGWVSARAEIVGANDALSADDARAFVLNVRSAPTYALITRESDRPHASSSHFLERAIAPRRRDARASERVVRLDPEKLDPQALATAAVVLLDHPGKLSADSINTLAGLMRRGRGLLYIASEPVDATNLKLIADAAGTDLKMPVEFVLPAPGAPMRHGLFLDAWKMDQPPFAELRESASALLQPLRFGGGLPSKRLPGGLSDDVLATYSDQSAAMVVTACGAGSLAVLNADLMQSSIVTSPAFVPVMSELIGRLVSGRGAAESVAPGERMAAYLPPEAGAAQGLTLVADPKPEQMGELTDIAGGVVWRWEDAGAPGIFSVKRDQQTVFAIAAATPALESDLATLPPDVLTTRLSGGRSVAFSQAGAEPPADSTWTWLLVACSACIVGEIALLRTFRT